MIRTLKNSLWIAFGQLGGRIAGMAAAIYLAHFLGPSRFGQYNLVLMLLAMGGQIADLGVETYVTREVAKAPQRKEIVEIAVPLKLVLSTAAFLVLAGVIWFRVFDIPWAWMVIAGLSLTPGSLANVYTAVLNGWQEIAYTSRLALATNIISAGLIVAVAAWSGSVGYAFWVVGAVALGRYWLLRRQVNQRGEFHMKWSPSAWRTMLRSSLPIYALSILGLVFLKMDSLLLSGMLGSSALGYYAAAYKLLEAVLVIPQALAGALFPSMAKASGEKRNVFRMFHMSARLLLTVGLPIAAGGTLLADRIMKLVFGAEYVPAGPALALLLWAALFMFLNAPAGNVILNSTEMKKFIPFAIANTVLNLGLNILLIPIWGYTAAGLVTFLTEITSYSINAYFIRRICGQRLPLQRLLVKPIIGAAFMGIVLWSVRQLPTLLLIGLGALVYGSVLYLLGEFGAVRRQLTALSKEVV